MEIKIKFGNSQIKFSDRDFLGKFGTGQNMFEAMTTKAGLEFYRKLYGNVPQNMLHYYKEFSKTFEKYLDTSKPGTGIIPDSPDVFPANGHDIFNYVARYGKGNFHCQAIMKLDGRVDYPRLSKAVRLSVEEEPVLGCRFVEGNPPYWKQMENIDYIMFCSLEEVADETNAVQRFLEKPLDMDNDPKIKVKVIRSKACDTIAVKANHACFDGTGIKEYTQLLSNIYSSITGGDSVFIPVPRKRGRLDQDRLFKSLGITDPDALWIPGSDISIPTWAFPWKQGTSCTTRIVTSRFPTDQLERMRLYAKARGATINDLIVTAYYRAMLAMGQPIYGVPMGLTVTIDLRRYLPDNKTEAIRNFSGSVNTWLTMIENETFHETLSRVAYMMNDIKNGYPGLQSAIGLERLEKISFKDTLSYYQATSKLGKNMPQCNAFYGNRCVPALSNLGILSDSLIRFGDLNVTDYYIIPPVVSPPGILLEVGTYNGVVTMAAGYFENTLLREDVKKLVNTVKTELMECCR